MQTRLIGFLFLILATSTYGQNHLLWKITNPNYTHTSYVFGSMHTNDSLLNTFDTNWWNAFHQCHVFAGEVNANDPLAMLDALQSALLKDTALTDLYTSEEYKAIEHLLYQRVDSITANLLLRMKPFYIMATLLELPDNEGPYDEIMDLRLQQIAADNRMTVVGLESLKEQMAIIAQLDLKTQAMLLLEYATSDSTIQTIELKTMEKMYHNQNIEAIYQWTLTQSSIGMDFMQQQLLTARNDLFVSRLIPLLEKDAVFCVIGALHLAGERGVIAQLRQAGFQLDPVPFEFKQP